MLKFQEDILIMLHYYFYFLPIVFITLILFSVNFTTISSICQLAVKVKHYFILLNLSINLLIYQKTH